MKHTAERVKSVYARCERAEDAAGAGPADTGARRARGTSVLDLVSDGPVLVSDWMNGCLDVPIGRCESA